MYQVLIVDDEPVIRNGIKAFIDWEKEGMRAEADCANGIEALEILERRPTDILITDIKMPLLNGIQLMQKALELYPRLKVIIISSYNDFEYAREGLKLGAIDYLLKPTLEPEDLLTVLQRCKGMLEEEKKQDSERSRYQLDSEFRERKKLEQETKRLLVMEQGTLSNHTGWAPEWMNGALFGAYVIVDHTQELREIHGNLYTRLILEELQESFYNRFIEGIAFPVSDNSLFLLLPEQDGGAERQLRTWQQELKENEEISISVGIHDDCKLVLIRERYNSCQTLCQRRFFEGLGGFYSTAARRIRVTEEEQGSDYPEWAEIAQQLRSRQPVSDMILKVHARWAERTILPDLVKQEAVQLLTEAYHIYGDVGTLLTERLDLLRQAETLEQLETILMRQLDELENQPSCKLTDKGYGGQIIQRALEYMTARYKEDITLQSTADAVHISKSYFSLLFKKQTGHNFIDYLIDLRIREAKRLLTKKDSRIYEVAAGAGFNDVKYFSKLFKKMTGITPMEYRDKNQASG